MEVNLVTLISIWYLTAGCEVYNLGTGKGTSVLEMVAAFEKASGKVLNSLTFFLLKSCILSFQLIEPFSMNFSISKLNIYILVVLITYIFCIYNYLKKTMLFSIEWLLDTIDTMALQNIPILQLWNYRISLLLDKWPIFWTFPFPWVNKNAVPSF